MALAGLKTSSRCIHRKITLRARTRLESLRIGRIDCYQRRRQYHALSALLLSSISSWFGFRWPSSEDGGS
jgi:hypothetical protein